jgi:hypothetical protein
MVIKDGRLIETVEGEMSVVAPDDPEVLELEPVTPVSNPSVPAQRKWIEPPVNQTAVKFTKAKSAFALHHLKTSTCAGSVIS